MVLGFSLSDGPCRALQGGITVRVAGLRGSGTWVSSSDPVAAPKSYHGPEFRELRVLRSSLLAPQLILGPSWAWRFPGKFNVGLDGLDLLPDGPKERFLFRSWGPSCKL